MKRELNIQLDTHMDLIQEMAFKSLGEIKVSEIIELRHKCKRDENMFFNQIKLRYILPLGLLGLKYKINVEVERILFGYINYLIHEIPVESMERDATLHISIN